MPPRPPIPRGLDHSSNNDNIQIEPRSRPAVNVSRPLPQLPTSSPPASYDIPSLRRKPLPEKTEITAGGHNRSFSHPFPSFLGGRKSVKKDKGPPGAGDVDIQDALGGQGDGMARKSTHNELSATEVPGDRQSITGKCMTCDSTVRWPANLKVFRCTTCLTINDLEPYDGQQNAESGSKQGPARKVVPISIDRTRKLIDQCLGDYMYYILEKQASSKDTGKSSQEACTLSDDEAPESPVHNREAVKQDHTILSPSRPRFQNRSRSDPRLVSTQMGSREELRSRVGEQPSNASRSPRRGEIRSQDTKFAVQEPIENDLCNNIFRAVESYVANCCTGCTAFNISFFSLGPTSHREEKNSRNPNPKQPYTDAGLTPASEPDVFISELDGKMLLLGDVAENGSWWTGNSSAREDLQTDVPRERSPDRWHGVVNAKSPRINWLELAEWYRLLTHAGENWRSKWNTLCPPEGHAHHKMWHSISLERIHRDILESQIHLQRSLLKATENLLKRPGRPLKTPETCRFLLMLLANPLIHPGFSGSISRHVSQSANTNQRGQNPISPLRSKFPPPVRRPSGNLGHHSGIVKRLLGLLANLPNEVHGFVISWFARLSDSHFQRLVEVSSSFVTYRLTRQFSKPVQEIVDPTAGLIPSFSDNGVRHASQLHAAIGGRANQSGSKKQENKPKVGTYSEDWQIKVAARVMALLFQANTGHTARKRDTSISPEQRLRSAGMNAKHHAHVHGQMIPINNFYNTMLDNADLVADFETWETTKTKFTFCQYPFFLSIWAKIHVLEHDARRQMESKAREAFFDSILSRKAVSQYLMLKVRRDCLVEDSLKTVSEVIGRGGTDIKKGLRIDFVGEEGVDAGGLRKEWFLLLVREIFNPEHGLFVYDEDSQYCYFNPFCFESSEQFFLVGVLLGLAIYNSTILDIAFPPFVFKKMLASAPPHLDKLTSTPKITHYCTLEDLAELRPSLARGLRQLLEFEGNVQDVFCRDFVAEMDRYGEVVQVPLCSGGERRAVTNSNRREFVDLYVRYLLDGAVARQYEPFKRGFFTVCGGNALSLFRPEEIELLVRGSDEPLDVNSLRAVASYDGWPKGQTVEEQPQVIWFWDFFQHASPVDQRKILSFITGSDRIPAMGATNLIIRLQLLLDKEAEHAGIESQRFPVARTCFNQLGLYRYHQRETLEYKLWMAVIGSEGFGLK